MMDPSARFTADDWGMSPGVNHGILELAQSGVIRRVSCLAQTRWLETGLADLLAVPGIELGLHFDLTHGKSTENRPRFSSLGELLKFCFRSGPRRALVRQAFQDQWRVLEAAGVPIRYVDGHQHVHLFPGVLGDLAKPMQERNVRKTRLPLDARLSVTRRAPVYWLAAAAVPVARRHGLEALPCLYPKLTDLRDPDFFSKRLKGHREVEIIVHPAKEMDFSALEINDDYREPRLEEFRLLQRFARTAPSAW